MQTLRRVLRLVGSGDRRLVRSHRRPQHTYAVGGTSLWLVPWSVARGVGYCGGLPLGELVTAVVCR